MIPPNDDRDDRMDELLIQGARDYNEPGAVPREAMWARIAEARARSSAVAAPVEIAGHAPTHSRRWMLSGGRGWLASAVAAGFLLTVGISIGRRMERVSPSNRATLTSPTATDGPGVAKRSAGATDSGRQTAAVPPAASAPQSPDSLLPRFREQTRATQREARELAASEAARGRRTGEGATGAESTGPRSTDNDLAYRLVVLQHLAGSEAMITAFRTSAHHGTVDAQIASWSRDLLSTTRMLESSPATQDPTMKRLLEDLDLVITQIVQYTTHGTHDPDELDLIEQSIAKRGVITKLRSTLPARAPATGT